MEPDLDRFLPLAPAALHILLSLAGTERHGYGIMQNISSQSSGRYKLGPGTLYDNLQKLMTERLVEECRGPANVAESRRRYYRLTKLGHDVLTAEIERLEQAIHAAKPHLGFGKGQA